MLSVQHQALPGTMSTQFINHQSSIINQTLINIFQLNFNLNLTISIQESTFQNIIKMLAILFLGLHMLNHCGVMMPHGNIDLVQHYLKIPSHNQNECWLLISNTLWHSTTREQFHNESSCYYSVWWVSKLLLPHLLGVNEITQIHWYKW